MNHNMNNQGNNIYSNWNNVRPENKSNISPNQANGNAKISQGNNTLKNTNNKMYSNWNEKVQEGYKPEEKPYLVMSDKELKNKRRLNGTLRFVIYGVFIIIGGMLVYMYQLDKYEFYLSKNEILIANESKYQLELIPKNAKYFDFKNYKYEIEDENIAQVNEYGEIKAKSVGETNLRIRYKNSFNYKTVKIKTENIDIEKIEIKDDKIGTIKEGESFELETVINDNEEIKKDVNCRSSDESIAIIDEDCKIVTPLKEGETEIIVEDSTSSKQDVTPIIVEPKKNEIEDIEIKESKISIKNGTKGKIDVEIKPEDAEDKELKYTSNNENVRVDDNGNIYGKKNGTSIITIESENGKKGYCTIEVTGKSIEIENIKLSEEKIIIKEGEEKELKPEIEPSNATERELNWESSNSNIVSVKDGKIKGEAAGEAEITVKTKNGKTSICKIIVESKEIKVTAIKLKEKSVKIEKGSTYIIGSEIEPSNATNKKLTYKSNNSNINVDSTGLVYASMLGKSVVTIENSSGIKETVEIEVVEKKVEPTGIKISATKKEMIKGETGELTVTIEPNDATVRTVTWTSSNKNIASVVNGRITAHDGGEVEIEAKTANGLIAKCTVNVKVPVNKLTINGPDNIKVKEIGAYNVNIEPSNATNKVVVWESTNSSVASVDSNGKVTGKTAGETKIKATVDGKSIEKKIVVELSSKIVETINIEPTVLELVEGEEKKFKISLFPNDAKDKTVVWSSSNTKIATITNGKVKGISEGDTEILVSTKDERVKATAKVKVVPKVIEVSEIKIKGETSVKIIKGSKYNVVVEVLPKNVSSDNITWTSSDKNIVEVDKNGEVTGKSVGKAIVTAKSSNGKTASVEIAVENQEIVPTKISFDKDKVEINEGETDNLNVYFEPKSTTLRTLTWKSSDNKIVSIVSGKITGKSSGTATITAKSSNGLEAKCTIIVKAVVTKVSVSGVDKIKVKETKEYETKIEPDSAKNDNITWTSSDNNIATVDEKGKVTGVKAGTITITATSSNGVYGSKTIIIEKPVISVSKIKINPSKIAINEGDSTLLSVDIEPNDSSDKKITWTSNKKDIATVDENGKIIGQKAGTAKITAKSSNGKTSTCEVTVNKPKVPVQEINLNIDKKDIYIGDSLNLTATITPENASNKNITWSSNKADVATVDKNGKIIGVGKGTATITAKGSNDKTAICTITVKENEDKTIKSISFVEKSITIQKKESKTVTPIFDPIDASNKNLTWTSSNPKVATIDKNGKVTGVESGIATITAKTENDKTASIKVEVQNLVTKISFDKSEISLEKNETMTITPKIEPSDAADKSLTWASSDEKVATVDNSGKITAVGNGSAKITATTSNKITANLIVKVNASLSKITFDKTEITIQKGTNETITPIFTPIDTSDNALTWTSSNNDIATVNKNGVVKGVKSGRVMITAKSSNNSNISATTQLTVRSDKFQSPLRKENDEHLNAADPFVTYDKNSGYYYFLKTTGKSYIVVNKSKYLYEIGYPEISKQVYTKGNNVWAPELHYINGYWYIYYCDTETKGDEKTRRNYVIKSKTQDPLGEYEKPIKLYDSKNDFYAIDGTVFQLNNKLYFVWSGGKSEKSSGGTQQLYISSMSSPTKLSSERVLISSPDYDWEKKSATINEGPEALIKNGIVHIIYSANYYHSIFYSLGMLTLTDPSKPLDKASWTKYEKPLLQQGNDVYGTGHASFTTSPDGTEDWIIYHAYESKDENRGSGSRVAIAQSFKWNEANPSFGTPVKVGTNINTPSEGKTPITWSIDKGTSSTCTQEVVTIYEDSKYTYTVSNGCIANYKVVYSNGESYTIKDALSKGKVTVNELIANGVSILKQDKTEAKSITPPTNSYCKSLTYNGSNQTLVNSAGEGFSWTDGIERKDAGSQKVTATLLSGYKWSDNSTGTKTINCSIEKATSVITLSETSGNVSVNGMVTFNEKANVKGKFEVKSSDTKIATVKQDNDNEIDANKDNKVTITGVAGGSTKIKITFTPTSNNYKSATTTYNITIIQDVTPPTDSICKCTGMTKCDSSYSNFKYSGNEQTLTTITKTNEYKLSGYKQTNAGSYKITASLVEGYKWKDGTIESKEITCYLPKATPTITLSKTSDSLYEGKNISFNEKASINGIFRVISSDAKIATVQQTSDNEIEAKKNNNVTVTGISPGKTKVTVTFTPTDKNNYNSETASYTAEVYKNVIMVITASNGVRMDKWVKSYTSKNGNTYNAHGIDVKNYANADKAKKPTSNRIIKDEIESIENAGKSFDQIGLWYIYYEGSGFTFQHEEVYDNSNNGFSAGGKVVARRIIEKYKDKKSYVKFYVYFTFSGNSLNNYSCKKNDKGYYIDHDYNEIVNNYENAVSYLIADNYNVKGYVISNWPRTKAIGADECDKVSVSNSQTEPLLKNKKNLTYVNIYQYYNFDYNYKNNGDTNIKLKNKTVNSINYLDLYKNAYSSCLGEKNTFCTSGERDSKISDNEYYYRTRDGKHWSCCGTRANMQLVFMLNKDL